MEWLLALFLITSPIFFWSWAVIFFFIIMVFEENECNLFAFISLGVFVALAMHSPVVTLAFEPMTWLMWAVVYYAAGGLWSFIKWFSFITKQADSFGEIKLEFIRNLNKRYNKGAKLPVDIKTVLPAETIREFKMILRSSDHKFSYITANNYDDDAGNLDDIIPLPSSHKEKIVIWILWWPTSAFWTILNDPLLRIGNWMYARLQGMYARIANRAFAKFGV